MGLQHISERTNAARLQRTSNLKTVSGDTFG
jgi:hypothetical protein